MRAALKMFITSVLMVLAGCAVSPEMHVGNMLQKTDASMAAGDLASAHGYIASAFDTGGQHAQLAKFFADKPERRDMYVRVMAYHIDDQLIAPAQAAVALAHINHAERALYIAPADAKALRQKLIAHAQRGNTSNTIEFMLRDELAGLGLDSARHKDIILKRTLTAANGATDAPNRQTAALMAYAAQPSTPSAHKKLIEKSLDRIPITKQEMEQYVRPVFPKYAESRLASMTLNAAFVYTGGDRIAREDLLDVVRHKIRGVEWLPRGEPATTVVKVERLRHTVHRERPRSETIRYNKRQVDYSIGRNMPDGSIYSFKLTKHAMSLEYGYEITVLVNGKVTHNTIVRGTERSDSVQCSDSMIRRAGGRARPASDPANYDMKRRCSSSAPSLDSIRRKIDNKITDAILAAPSISKIHQLNS